MSSKQTSKKTVVLVVVCLGCASERSLAGSLAGVLFPVVHLLEELLGLLLIHEGQAGQAFLELKGVEEDAVLVVIPSVEDLLVPNHPPVSGLSDVSQILSTRVIIFVALTEISTILIQYVLPTRSFARTTAPWRPV